jgi:hypothetical protein
MRAHDSRKPPRRTPHMYNREYHRHRSAMGDHMISLWVFLACASAGALIGFVAGATDEPAAGHITAGVTGFVACLLAASASATSRIDADFAARIFLIYLVALVLAYVLGTFCVDITGLTGSSAVECQTRTHAAQLHAEVAEPPHVGPAAKPPLALHG